MAVLTTSGAYTFSQSAINIITPALRICQVIGDEDTPTGAMLEQGLDTLNAMVKGWQATGIHLWCEEECILFPQANQNSYELGVSSTDKACVFSTLAQTSLSSTAAASATTIVVSSASGIADGYTIGIQQDNGVTFWTTVNGAPSGTTVTLASGLTYQATSGAVVFCYPLPLPRPLRLYSGRRYVYVNSSNVTAIETPMTAMSRLDYANQPNKATTGVITQYFFDPQQNQNQTAYTSPLAVVHLWPTPQDNQSGFRFTAQRPIMDFSNLSNLPDFPAEWMVALKWNLALEMAPEYGVPQQQIGIIQERAARWYTVAQSWDREPEGIRFGVAMRPALRRGA